MRFENATRKKNVKKCVLKMHLKNCEKNVQKMRKNAKDVNTMFENPVGKVEL